MITTADGTRTRFTVDVLAAALVAICAALMAWHLFGVFDPLRAGSEQWFQADIGRVWRVLTDRYSGSHERSRLHPLFSLVNTTSVYAIRLAAGVAPEVAVRIWLSATAAVLASVCFVTARLMRLRVADATLATGIVLVSSSLLFWASVPETKVVGAVTILLCVAAAAINRTWRLPDWALVAFSAASLSMTSSNVMAGLALLVVLRPVRRAVQLAVNAFFVVAVLQVVQNAIFWYARGMTDLHGESRFLFDRSAGGLLSKLTVSLVHSIVMPALQTPIEFDTHHPMLSVQQSPLFGSGALHAAAVLTWSIALGWGAVMSWRHRDEPALAVAMLTACGQVAFHLVYGDQTFLYALHFLPLLVLVAAQALRSPHPAIARSLLAALLAMCAVNNVASIDAARRTLDVIAVPDAASPEGSVPDR